MGFPAFIRFGRIVRVREERGELVAIVTGDRGGLYKLQRDQYCRPYRNGGFFTWVFKQPKSKKFLVGLNNTRVAMRFDCGKQNPVGWMLEDIFHLNNTLALRPELKGNEDAAARYVFGNPCFEIIRAKVTYFNVEDDRGEAITELGGKVSFRLQDQRMLVNPSSGGRWVDPLVVKTPLPHDQISIERLEPEFTRVKFWEL